MLFLGVSSLQAKGYLLPVELFPRSIALGNAVVTSDGSSSLFVDNPAAITTSLRSDLAVALSFKDGISTSTVSFTMPLLKETLYLGFYGSFFAKSSSASFIDLGTVFPVPLNFNGGLKGAMGLAFKPTSNFSFGVALQFLIEFENNTEESLEPFLTLGFEYYIPLLRLKLGLSMANLRPTLDARVADNDYLEQIKWGGDFLLLDRVFHKINLLFSLIKIRGNSLQAGFGCEYVLMKNWAFRVGWNSQDDFPRVGLGYKALSVVLGLRFDLSFRYLNETGSSFLFSFGFDF